MWLVAQRVLSLMHQPLTPRLSTLMISSKTSLTLSNIRQFLSHLFVISLILYGGCLKSSMSHAICLLSYDTASPLSQGDGLGRLSFQGGSQGFATHLGARLGLTGDREIHVRSGGCQRSDLWGGAFDIGVNQRLMAHHTHENATQAYFLGPVDVALRVSAVSFMTDSKKGARTDLGFQPVALVSYPIALDTERQGAITLSAGMNIYSSDRRVIVNITDQFDMIEEERLSSQWRWSEILALGLSLEVIDHLPVALELRWQDRGFIAGASAAYQF